MSGCSVLTEVRVCRCEVGNAGAPSVETYRFAGPGDCISLRPPHANENDNHCWYDALKTLASEAVPIEAEESTDNNLCHAVEKNIDGVGLGHKEHNLNDEGGRVERARLYNDGQDAPVARSHGW